MADNRGTPSELAPKIQEPSLDLLRAEHKAEIRAARSAGQRWRRISRWLGLGIFCFGILLLAYVFWQAFVGFGNLSNSGYLSSQLNNGGDDLTSVVVRALAVIGRELLKVLYLLILGFLASAIAARGIQFFAASEAVIDEAVVPDDVS